MSVGTGIAVAGAWAAVAMIGFHAGEAAVMVAYFAALATIIVAVAS